MNPFKHHAKKATVDDAVPETAPATHHTAASEKTPVGPGSHPVTLPNRQASTSTAASDDAVPITNPMNTSELLAERLQAWKHAVGYLEEYVTATEKISKAQAKEYEKVLKTIQNPLREGHHFDQSLGGVAGLFENMRTNTQGLVNTHLETERNLKGSVLPILERLHQEIKNKSKELQSGAVKSAKELEKARNTTQRHIELLGQQAASFESSGGRINAADDPYIVRRGVLHRLSQQVLHENNHRHDVISVQNNFQQFEAHVIEVIQSALASFNQFVGGQAQKQQQLYSDILGTAQRIPADFEWLKFTVRNGDKLVDPHEPDRTMEGIAFPNQGHKSTKPLIEGTLERKSRNKLSMSGYTTAYYVVTESKYLHEFKDNDNLRKDPVPELSIYLPDAVIGAASGEKFNIKGKDVSKGIGAKLSGSAEIGFKAHTAADAQTWYEVLRSVAGTAPSQLSTNEAIAPVSPVSPISPGVSKTTEPSHYAGNGATAAHPSELAHVQTSGITGSEQVASPFATTQPALGGASHHVTPEASLNTTANTAETAHVPEKA